MWWALVACAPHLVSDTANQVDTGSSLGDPWVAPVNDWPMGAPPADLRGQGWERGQVPPDVRWMDQRGDEVSLWQFYGNIVVIDLSTMWCAPCRDLAADVQATQDAFGDQGFVYLTVLSEDVGTLTPDQQDLNDWADYFGITGAPVVSDADRVIDDVLAPTGAYPVPLILDREMVILKQISPATPTAVDGAVAAAMEL